MGRLHPSRVTDSMATVSGAGSALGMRGRAYARPGASEAMTRWTSPSYRESAFWIAVEDLPSNGGRWSARAFRLVNCWPCGGIGTPSRFMLPDLAGGRCHNVVLHTGGFSPELPPLIRALGMHCIAPGETTSENGGIQRFFAGGCAGLRVVLEVRAGIEPAYADLQSAASPLCHRTPGSWSGWKNRGNPPASASKAI